MEAFCVNYDDIFLGNEYENFAHAEEKKKSILMTSKRNNQVRRQTI